MCVWVGGWGEGWLFLHTLTQLLCKQKKKKNLVTNLFSFSISLLSGLSGCRDDGRACVQAPTVSVSPPTLATSLCAWWNCSRHSLSPSIKTGPCFVHLVNPMTNGWTHRSRASWGSSFNSLPSVRSCVYTSQSLKIGPLLALLPLPWDNSLQFPPVKSLRDWGHFKDAGW